MNCRKITTRFWCMISSTQWVFMWTYLCLLLRIRTLSSWWYNFSVANSFCAKNKASKSSRNFTAVVIQQNQFYCIGPRTTLVSLFSVKRRNSDRHVPLPPTLMAADHEILNRHQMSNCTMTNRPIVAALEMWNYVRSFVPKKRLSYKN